MFIPDGEVTRAHFSTILVRILKLPLAPNQAFVDVKESDWYAKYVRTAYLAGIVEGYGNGVFKPEQSITRQEMAAMLQRALKYKYQQHLPISETQMRAKYADYALIADYSRIPARVMAASEIMIGRTDTTFNPQNTATRAEAVVVFTRYLKYIKNH